ncbi:MAG: response regulator [Geminicoccaceae bacterium]
MNPALPNETPIELLLIDDDQSDIYLAQRALKQCRTPLRIQVARHGEEALSLLRREEGHSDARRPDLIFLDLNMPRMNGHEFLAEIKADDDLKSIPTIVMSMSESDVDMQESYCLQASAYISKPIELAAFGEVIRSIEDHWFTIARLPQRRES